MVPTKFIKNISVYEIDAEGKSTDKVVKNLGVFTFRQMTIRDEINIGVERSKNLHGSKSAEVDPDIAIMADAMARLSILCVDKPKDYWEKITDARELWAIYKAYNEGPDEPKPVAVPEPEDARAEPEGKARAEPEGKAA